MEIFKTIMEFIGGMIFIPMITAMSAIFFFLIIAGLGVGIADKIRKLTGNEIVIKGGTKDVKEGEQ